MRRGRFIPVLLATALSASLASAQVITPTSASGGAASPLGLTPNTITIPASGTAPTGATQLSSYFTAVSGGSATAPLQLPLGNALGDTTCRLIRNSGTVALPLYPPAGGTVGTTNGVNVPTTLYGGEKLDLCSTSPLTWLGAGTFARQYLVQGVTLAVPQDAAGATVTATASLAAIKLGDAVHFTQTAGALQAGQQVVGFPTVSAAGQVSVPVYNNAGLTTAPATTLTITIFGLGP